MTLTKFLSPDSLDALEAMGDEQLTAHLRPYIGVVQRRVPLHGRSVVDTDGVVVNTPRAPRAKLDMAAILAAANEMLATGNLKKL